MMTGSFLRGSYVLPEVTIVVSRAFCEAGLSDRRLDSHRDHDFLGALRFNVGLSRLR